MFELQEDRGSPMQLRLTDNIYMDHGQPRLVGSKISVNSWLQQSFGFG